MNLPKKVGIFSGSFDPVHVGHIEFALDALRILNLEQVVFLPEDQPRQKSPVSLHHRQEMLKLAVAKHAKLSVISLDQQQFSVATTLPQLQNRYPHAQLVFLLGSDIVQTFSYRWPELDMLLASAHLVIGLRAGDHTLAISDQLQATYTYYKVKPNYSLLSSPREHLASTTIRAGSHTLNDLNPDVANYISKHNLYQ